MTKKRNASKSVPMCNARLELAWINGDSLGSTCFFTNDEGKRSFIEAWIPVEFASDRVGELAQSLGDAKKAHFSLTRDEVNAIAESFSVLGKILAPDAVGVQKLQVAGAFAVAKEVRDLLWTNGRKAFAGLTAVRLTVFAPKS